jgi:hypothetical protein
MLSALPPFGCKIEEATFESRPAHIICFAMKSSMCMSGHHRSVWRSLLLACLAVVHAPLANAFAVQQLAGIGGTVHQDLTRESLSAIQYVSPSGSAISFADNAKNEVVAANRNVDRYQDFPFLHFDDNQLRAGSIRVLTLKKKIIAALSTQSPITVEEAHKVRTDLGRLLHTLQDFYSHSTWVENHLVSLETAKLLGFDAQPINQMLGTGVLQDAQANGDNQHCDRLTRSFILSSELFSEYAITDTTNDFTEVQGLQQGIAPDYECAHGLVGNGIHKDWPGRQYYEQAARLARAASWKIVSDTLVAATNEQSKCRFMTGELCAVAVPTTTALAASPNPVPVNQPVALNASIAPAPGQTAVATPSGTITFAGGDVTATCSVSATLSGAASCSTMFSSPGTYTVQAEYSGDANFLPSAATQQVTVTAPPFIAIERIEDAGCITQGVETTSTYCVKTAFFDLHCLSTIEPCSGSVDYRVVDHYFSMPDDQDYQTAVTQGSYSFCVGVVGTFPSGANCHDDPFPFIFAQAWRTTYSPTGSGGGQWSEIMLRGRDLQGNVLWEINKQYRY